jgi:LPS sulfotransferase NodH
LWCKRFEVEPRELLEAIFRAAIAKGTPDTGIFGLRLQKAQLRFLHREASCPFSRAFAAIGGERIADLLLSGFADSRKPVMVRAPRCNDRVRRT